MLRVYALQTSSNGGRLLYYNCDGGIPCYMIQATTRSTIHKACKQLLDSSRISSRGVISPEYFRLQCKDWKDYSSVNLNVFIKHELSVNLSLKGGSVDVFSIYWNFMEICDSIVIITRMF